MRTKKQIRQEMKLQNIKQKQKRIKRELKNEKNKTHNSSIFSFLDIFRKKPVPTTSADENCYRTFSMELFDSLGEKIQKVNFEKAFVVKYKDTFSSKRGRAGYEIVIRECKGTH